MSEQQFDIAIIGGGINGAGIAREAAMRGLRVLLIEGNDFAAGTTSRSTRLIHGGLRYLEHAELRLVFEALQEREALLRDVPHLVRPLTLLLPVYRSGSRGPLTVRAGLALYDLLSLRKSLSRHRALLLDRLPDVEPVLDRTGLAACYQFQDAQVEWPERLTLEAVLDARDWGAVTLNHVRATGLRVRNGRVAGLDARDAITGEELAFEAGAIVNAGGPWVDAVLKGIGIEWPRLIGGTKGTHLVVDYGDRGPRHAILAAARSDGRPFFVIPWNGLHLIGTTDIRFDADPSDATASPQEIAYLLTEANALLPGAMIDYGDILYTCCGVRPLPYTRGQPEGAITRRHMVLDHSTRHGPHGLFSVIGGKLTTYRSLARQAVDQVLRGIDVHRPIYPAVHARTGGSIPMPVAELPEALRLHLLLRYGRRAGKVADLIASDPSLAEPLCPHGKDVRGQVVWAVKEEMARTLGDVLLRRTGAAWNRCRGVDAAEPAAKVMSALLGWDSAERAAQLAAYQQELDRVVPLPATAGEATQSTAS